MNYASFGNEMVNMDRVVFIRRNFTNRAMTDMYFTRNDYLTVCVKYEDVMRMLEEVQRKDRGDDL